MNGRSWRWRWRLLFGLAGGLVLACSTGDPGGDDGSATTPAGTTGTSGGAPASATTSSDVGRVTIHRLNGVEYDNTVRDLLGDTSHPSSAFPADDGAYGFDNIADALSISPILFEQYDLSAERLATNAVQNADVMICDPTTAGASACAGQILGPFLNRAWRRRIAPDEVAALVAVVTNAIASGSPFADAMQVAIKAALLSPNFLFRVETNSTTGGAAPRALDDYELANRLSYFLWSTMPDDALFAFADARKLTDERVLARQVRRMLVDPKAHALIDNFASQWLLHTFDQAAPDATLFPSFDDALRASMRAETKAFVGSFVLGDQRLPDLFDANFSFLDARMAAHYGIAGVTGGEPVRVALDPGSHRGGLLTQASILTMTSVATRTSVVRRGEWVLSELLCSPPPPPPPNVPALPETVGTGTMRQRLEEHRKNPACASCHTQMDPIGFALEHYDALGRWRETDNGEPIDASGVLPGGAKIDGEVQLAQALEKDPRFIDCATRKLFAYALGRVPAPADERRIKGLVNAFAKDDFKTEELIVTIIASDAFRMRQDGN